MSVIFEEFQGADLDRLTACIDAVRKAELKITKYSQAGINPNSGYVWIWNEDWAGTVCCTLQGVVCWYWSCPECGEEYDFETYAELEAWQREQGKLDTDDMRCPSCRD
jgi:hypothetical protein